MIMEQAELYVVITIDQDNALQCKSWRDLIRQAQTLTVSTRENQNRLNGMLYMHKEDADNSEVELSVRTGISKLFFSKQAEKLCDLFYDKNVTTVGSSQTAVRITGCLIDVCSKTMLSLFDVDGRTYAPYDLIHHIVHMSDVDASLDVIYEQILESDLLGIYRYSVKEYGDTDAAYNELLRMSQYYKWKNWENDVRDEDITDKALELLLKSVDMYKLSTELIKYYLPPLIAPKLCQKLFSIPGFGLKYLTSIQTMCPDSNLDNNLFLLKTFEPEIQKDADAEIRKNAKRSAYTLLSRYVYEKNAKDTFYIYKIYLNRISIFDPSGFDSPELLSSVLIAMIPYIDALPDKEFEKYAKIIHRYSKTIRVSSLPKKSKLAQYLTLAK